MRIWHYTDGEVQKENFKNLYDLLKNKMHLLASLWTVTNAEVQQENVNILSDLIKNYKKNSKALITLWKKTTADAQQKEILELRQLLSSNKNTLVNIWFFTKSSVQNQNPEILKELIDEFSNNTRVLYALLDKSNPETVKQMDFENILLNTINIREFVWIAKILENISPEKAKEVEIQAIPKIIEKMRGNANLEEGEKIYLFNLLTGFKDSEINITTELREAINESLIINSNALVDAIEFLDNKFTKRRRY